MRELTLKIVTPKEVYGPFTCDSIRLTVSDAADGHGGGSYGIHAGHTASLLSLSKGKLQAFSSGKPILEGTCDGGFASVERDAVTAVVEEYTPLFP